MKVYFDATPREIDRFGEIYQRIGKCVENLGHDLTSKWILKFDSSFYEMPREEWKVHYKKIVGSMELADVVVVDISVSSTSIGQLIQQALIWRKPVIAIRSKKEHQNIFLEGAGEVESKLIMVEYDVDNLEERLKEAIEYVEEWLMESRFTFIADGETRRFLDLAAKSGESRSDYIRRLIRENAERTTK